MHLVIGDVSSLPFGSHPPGNEEYHIKQQFLTQCVCALKVHEVNGLVAFDQNIILYSK